MDKKELNNLIPAELKAKLKKFLESIVPTPVVQSAPVAPVAPIAQAAPIVQDQPVTLQEATLEDGTVIKYDTPSLAVGSVITIVSPEGEMPAPVGEHKLQDGTVIKVGEGGKVEAVTPGAPVAPVAPVTQNIEPQLAQMKEDFKSTEAKNIQLKKELDEQKAEFKALDKKFSEFIVLFGQVLDLPTAQPIEKPKNKTGVDRFINR